MFASTTVLPGYGITEVLHETTSTVVYRGYRVSNNTPVVIKMLKSEYPSIKEIHRFKHEYSITLGLDIPGIVTIYDLIEHGNGLALVLEDFGGISLKQVIKTTKIGLEEFLCFSIHLAEALAALHAHKIIHKDIKPQNIIVNPETGQVKLTDFSIASQLLRETPSIATPDALEGTLAYMSPEQTGRMNRGVDYRTDFYSLGVTFYELLTGQLPFQSDDAIELVHSHIAKTPTPPPRLNPAIPVAVSDVVMKLLAKNAEDRYQTAYGLKADLENCLFQWREHRAIAPFPLGRRDQQGQFHIPEKLYGREKEVAELLAAFARIALPQGKQRSGGRSQGTESKLSLTSDPRYLTHTSELILVAGYSGIGKSALVNEIHKPIVQQRGYFISGKFDQFKRNIPYSSLVQAFQDLIQQLLTERESQIARWQAVLTEALGNNGQVLIDVLPELELILGAQPPVPQLGPSEVQNRFHLLFRRFIQVFAQPQHPLVIFLDDLQWADSASLNLIQLLMTDAQSRALLIIGAYRDNEVDSTHPLMAMLEAIQQTRQFVQTITLQNLDADQVNRLITDTLNCSAQAADSLTDLLLSKTQGNPLFLTQLLKSLYQEGLLRFDVEQGEWQWDMEQIRQTAITDNVVEFMVDKIQKLPPSTQQSLKLASCIGNVFALQTLATVAEKTWEAIAQDLWVAIQDGLVIPIGDAYRIPLAVARQVGNRAITADIAPDLVVTYRFLHDRVQQAAYKLILKEERRGTHLKVGRLLLHHTSPAELEEKLFDIVNSLNIGAELMTDQREKEDLARLNLRAGQKAKAATAYEPASRYFTTGLNLLNADTGSQVHDLMIDLHIEAATAAYLMTDYERSQALVQTILTQTNDRLERVKAYELKIQLHMAQLQMADAIQAGLDALDLLGVQMIEATDEVENKLALPNLSDLPNLPEMTCANQMAALRLLRIVLSPAYQSQPETFRRLVLTQTQLCIDNGSSAPAAFAYVAYGWLMCGRFGEIDRGYQAGQIALALLEQFDAKALKCSVWQIFETFIRPWKEHLHTTFLPLTKAIQIGQDTGDIGHVSYCVMNYCTHLFLSGEALDEVARKQLQYVRLLTDLKQEFQLYYTQLLRQLTLNLKEPDSAMVELIGESFDETEILPRLQAANNDQSLFAVYVAKLILAYFFKAYDEAIAAAHLAANYAQSGAGLALSGAYCFYHTLTLLAIYDRTPTAKQEADLQQILSYQQKLQQWAAFAPVNYQHKCDLIAAELAWIEQKPFAAMDYFDRAIQGAKAQKYLQEEAIANERAAEFYLSLNRERIAQAYMTDAYYGYLRWGAIAKAKQLEEQYTSLLTSIITKDLEATTLTRSSHSSSNRQTNLLDLATVLKASQTLSSEIVLNNLLENLIKIAIENAGAQRGFFITKEDYQWVIQAEGTVDQAIITKLHSSPLETSQALPISIVHYVIRTKENLVLDDATTEEKFLSDPYIANQQPKSILCFPVLHKGNLTSVLYLENNLITSAFTADRLELLNVLMSQISISIENARLYTNLQTYSQELETKSKELELKNWALYQSGEREREKAQELVDSLHKLQQTQAQLIQTEKISSLGQLVAGVAHEVNNPLGFISGNLKYVQDYTQDLMALLKLYQRFVVEVPDEIQDKIEEVDLPYVLEDLPKMIASMQVGTDRIREIMLSLRTFSRMDADKKQPADIHAGIESTLLILQHRLKAKPEHPAIHLVKRYGDLPLVPCFAGQLNQVFMNLIANAIDAMEEANVGRSYSDLERNPNIITIRTEIVNNYAVIGFADNGPGIPEEVRQRLFDPFFTTKAVGKGTGLGLSISYQIVTEKHGGRLSCRSTLGQGTEFIIEIPIS
jgi:predicted ATPase/signal transduction histidine kinase